MSGDIPLSQVSRGLAAVRAAEALLRTLGGTTIIVRMPQDVVTAGDFTQLGLQAIATQDVELSPVVARALTPQKDSLRRVELSISAASLSRAKDINDADSAEQFFYAALGVFYADRLWRIAGLQVEEFGGMPYLYRLTVSE